MCKITYKGNNCLWKIQILYSVHPINLFINLNKKNVFHVLMILLYSILHLYNVLHVKNNKNSMEVSFYVRAFKIIKKTKLISMIKITLILMKKIILILMTKIILILMTIMAHKLTIIMAHKLVIIMAQILIIQQIMKIITEPKAQMELMTQIKQRLSKIRQLYLKTIRQPTII